MMLGINRIMAIASFTDPELGLRSSLMALSFRSPPDNRNVGRLANSPPRKSLGGVRRVSV